MFPGPMFPGSPADNELRNLQALQHGRWLQEQELDHHKIQLATEPPLNKVKYSDDWLKLHFKVIQRLVEEPMFAQPRVGEPCLEVCILGAKLYGPWMHPLLNVLKKPFVRHYIDTEMIGETKRWEGDPRVCHWNEKMLFLPRGAKISQFEILNDTDMPLVLGDCALNTETIWTTAKNCGRYLIELPILYQSREVGSIQLRFCEWNGRPLDEERVENGNLFGTLAGMVDNDSYGYGANQPMPMGPFGLPGPMGMSNGFPGMMPGSMAPSFGPAMPPYMAGGNPRMFPGSARF